MPCKYVALAEFSKKGSGQLQPHLPQHLITFVFRKVFMQEDSLLLLRSMAQFRYDHSGSPVSFKLAKILNGTKGLNLG